MPVPSRISVLDRAVLRFDRQPSSRAGRFRDQGHTRMNLSSGAATNSSKPDVNPCTPERSMSRKLMFALTAVAALGIAALSPTSASPESPNKRKAQSSPASPLAGKASIF